MQQDLSGKWTGKLTFGKNFGRLEHEPLFFTLEIQQRGDEFTGISRDIDGVGVNPFEAGISGFLDNGSINFVREYQLPILYDQAARADLSEKKPGTEISFSGTYNTQTGEFEGDWIILSGYVLHSNVFFEDDNGGSWRMKRELP